MQDIVVPPANWDNIDQIAVAAGLPQLHAPADLAGLEPDAAERYQREEDASAHAPSRQLAEETNAVRQLAGICLTLSWCPCHATYMLMGQLVVVTYLKGSCAAMRHACVGLLQVEAMKVHRFFFAGMCRHANDNPAFSHGGVFDCSQTVCIHASVCQRSSRGNRPYQS